MRLVVADDSLIVREGLRAAVEIRERHPGTAVLVLSQYIEMGWALRLLREGAGSDTS